MIDYQLSAQCSDEPFDSSQKPIDNTKPKPVPMHPIAHLPVSSVKMRYLSRKFRSPIDRNTMWDRRRLSCMNHDYRRRWRSLTWDRWEVGALRERHMASRGEGTSSDERYAKELDVAVKAVHMACSLCQRVQQRLLSAATVSGDHVLSKDDDSPVTVAGTLYPPASDLV